MPYYFHDSGSNNWQLGITTLGQLTTTNVGAETISTYTLEDGSGVYWQLGITTNGQLTTTSVGATTVTPIILVDSNNITWSVGVTTSGQLTTTGNNIIPPASLSSIVIYSDYQWGGGDPW